MKNHRTQIVVAGHVCLEEGTQSAWLYELLKPHVAEIAVSMPPEKRGAKSDERDAWTRANELRTGTIETRVYKAPAQLAASAAWNRVSGIEPASAARMLSNAQVLGSSGDTGAWRDAM